MTRNTDFSRTALALKRRDYLIPRIWETIDRIIESIGSHTTDEMAEVAGSKIRRLYDRIHLEERKVGEAFGLDTAEFNSSQTCAEVVRAGEPMPPLGMEHSFVRKLVAQWQAARQ